MEAKKFDEKKYKQNYDKENYTKISFALKKHEAQEFKNKLKAKNIGISEFLKECVKNLK